MALRINHGVIVHRAIFEVEDKTTRHPVSMNRLQEVALRQNLPIGRTKHQKTVDQPFCVSDRHRLSNKHAPQYAACEKNPDANMQGRPRSNLPTLSLFHVEL